MNKICEMDTSAVNALFSSLNKEMRDGMMLKAMYEGGKVLQEKTRQQLISKMGHGATATSENRPRQMVKGITNKKDKTFNEVRVSIMGDFRLKWFELGTKERKLRRTGAKDRERGRYKGDRRYLYRKKGEENFYRAGGNRGRIKPLGFFGDARKEESDIINAIESSIEKQIKRIAN